MCVTKRQMIFVVIAVKTCHTTVSVSMNLSCMRWVVLLVRYINNIYFYTVQITIYFTNGSISNVDYIWINILNTPLLLPTLKRSAKLCDLD